MENDYPVLIMAVLVLIFLWYKEIARAEKARLLIRSAAGTGAVTGLVLLFLPLKLKKGQAPRQDTLYLLTAGVTRKPGRDTLFSTTDTALLRQYRKYKINFIPDLSYYLRQHPEINTIHAEGYGLTSTALSAAEGYHFLFRPSALPAGILRAEWSPVIKETERLEIQGTYNSAGGQPVKLVLNGSGTTFDSVMISHQGETSFSMGARPLSTGRTVYQLLVYRGKDTLEQEKIPFQVLASVKPRILILSSFPDFEDKFLKEWLFRQQYEIVLRTRVSKDKFSTEVLNSKGREPEILSGAALQHFDLVIADEEELFRSDAVLAGALRSAVNQGTGMLIRINALQPRSVFSRNLSLAAGDSSAKTVLPLMTGVTGKFSALPAKQLIFIRPGNAEQVLVADAGGRALVSSSLSGKGFLAVSTLPSTYHWMLTGDQSAYAQFWSALIHQLARKTPGPLHWQTVPSVLNPGEESQLYFDYSQEQIPPLMQVGGQQFISVQQQVLPFRWKTTFWPSSAGWQQAGTNQEKQFFYVYQPADWQGKKALERLSSNSARQRRVSREIHQEPPPGSTFIPLSKWWGFLLFILSAAFLWFETKLL